MVKKHKRTYIGITVAVVLIAVILVLAIAFRPRINNAIYIYMCGSTLESKSGMATKNIEEILKAEVPKDTVVIIETGGSSKWQNENIQKENIGRYIVKNNELKELEILSQDNMGESETFTDFLSYCKSNYDAENKGLILWNHGGGSIDGVCFDQNYDMDSLLIDELDSSLKSADMHFDFIGFDACLMSTVNIIKTVSPYSDYLIASEEIEPQGGWDYKYIIENFSHEKNMFEFGKGVCMAYQERCGKSTWSNVSTLSLIDLKKANDFMIAFDTFSSDLEAKSNQKYGNFEIYNAAKYATKFGGNSRFEGYSNLIDIYDFAEQFKGKIESADNLLKSIDETVAYIVCGSKRIAAHGISLYYPLKYKSDQLDKYLNLSKIDSYNKYLKNMYNNIPSETIKYEDKGSISKDGNFQITLSQDSKKYIKSVDFYLMGFRQDEENKNRQIITGYGVDNDITSDWNNMHYESNFRGVWLGINDKTFTYEEIDSNEERIVFSAPVLVNGTFQNLRFTYEWDGDEGEYSVLGLWEGIDNDGVGYDGAASKQITPLKEGDVLTLYRQDVFEGDFKPTLVPLEPITVGKDGITISEIPLKDTHFQYVFMVTDIFGNAFFSNSAIMEMKYTYDELLENPLPDGTPATSIEVIEDIKQDELKAIYDGVYYIVED